MSVSCKDNLVAALQIAFNFCFYCRDNSDSFLCTDICVISNALMIKAKVYETPVIVDSSCCAGVTPASHAAALTTMTMCQIDVK